MRRLSLLFILFIVSSLFISGCASSYLKGVSSEGKPVYIGTSEIQETQAFKNFLSSKQSETDKQNYLFDRIKDAKDLIYIRDGAEYTWLQAYRGGKWLIRNRYEKGVDARTFAKKYVWKSDSGNPHLVRFPNGDTHIGYYILLNELDLLEENTLKS